MTPYFRRRKPGSGGFQNFNNLRADRASSTLDQTQRFLFNTVYEAPFFRNQHGIAARH